MTRSAKLGVADMCLKEADPLVYDMLQREQKRQFEGLELIASENFTSRAVMEVVGSAFTNKYSEGLPGARYYGGNEVIDELERETQRRALHAFGLDPTEWGVNVQPYSGSTANFCAFTAVLEPHDRVMGLDLPSGGHLSHGFYRGHRKINCSSIYFESLPYKVHPDTGIIDYDKLEQMAALYAPKLILAGGSAYPREWDYGRMRKIADASKVSILASTHQLFTTIYRVTNSDSRMIMNAQSFLLTDMAHISGLVATGVVDSPFKHSHIVTTTTHKSLRGPRAALIFYRLDKEWNLERRVNSAVFPGCQGGPHNHAIAGICVQLREVATPSFKAYCEQVIRNAKALANKLTELGYTLVSGGTDNHLILWDLRPEGLTGSKIEALCDRVGITINKNSVYGDASAMSPGGARLGAPALTSRGLNEEDFEKIAVYMDRAVTLARQMQAKCGKKIADFRKALEEKSPELDQFHDEVRSFARSFPMPGFDTDSL